MINNVKIFVMTKGIANAIDNGLLSENEIHNSISRFMCEDWGDICEDDKEMNVVNDIWCMLLGSYSVSDEKIWIIANAIDESSRVVTVLFPSEY